MWSCNACTCSIQEMPPKPWPGLQFLFQEWIEGRKKSVVFNKNNETKPAKDKKIHPNIYPTIHPTIYTEVHKLQTFTILQKTCLTEKKYQDARSFHHFCSENGLIFFHARKRVISLGPPEITSEPQPSPTWVSLGTARQGDTNAVATFLGHNQWCLGGSCPTFFGAESFVKPSPWRS